MAYGLYSVGIATIKGQLQKELSVQNANFSESLRTELERITLLQYDLINDWDLKKLTLDIPIYTDYEKSEMILNIKNRIVPIPVSYTHLDVYKRKISNWLLGLVCNGGVMIQGSCKK